MNTIFDADMNPIGEVDIDPVYSQALKNENAKRNLKFLKELKIKAIETHIYSQYSKDKQAQDQVWMDNFRTKLVAMGVVGVEAKVVGGVKAFMGGVTIAEYLKDENVEIIPLLEKLIRIGVRSEWAYQCILEGKKAIAEDREPVYAEYPNV
jgi:hypothetical protein